MNNKKPHIAIITSAGANFYSIEVALQRLGISYTLTNDKNIINNADGAILAGVGAAKYAMSELAKNDLVDTIRNYKKPLLGICLGMQLLFEHSTEGDVACLGILPRSITRLPATTQFMVPHIGWDNLNLIQPEHFLLKNITTEQDVYFVHSFFAPLGGYTVASCSYSQKFSAIVAKDNFHGMQFHPEKSGEIGSLLIKNFIDIIETN